MNEDQETDLDRHPVAACSSIAGIVPVIDIGGLVSAGRIDPRHPAVSEIAEAARHWGFFQVVNHGVASAEIELIWRETKRLFARPQSDKDALLRTRDNPWGYYNNELTKNQRDKKEVFDFTTAGNDAIYQSANRWPDSDEGFRRAMLAYLKTCTDLSFQLLQAFCVGLDVPANFLQREFSPEHTGFVRLNYYPVRDPMLGSKQDYRSVADLGIHHHSDAGALTVLLQDAVGGLQFHYDNEWHDIPVVGNAFVINTGDMMQVWSNDRYTAAVHRVLAMQDTERFSIPFFFNPSSQTTVEPFPSLVGEGRPQRYRKISWAEYRGMRTDGDYANYGEEIQISQYRV